MHFMRKKGALNKFFKWIAITLIVFIIFIVISFFKMVFFPYSPPIDRTNYDTSCMVDSDCIIYDRGGLCGWQECINKEKVEEGKVSISQDGMVQLVSADSCAPPPVACRCISHVCSDIELYEQRDIDDCKYIDNKEQREACFKIIAEREVNISICSNV